MPLLSERLTRPTRPASLTMLTATPCDRLRISVPAREVWPRLAAVDGTGAQSPGSTGSLFYGELGPYAGTWVVLQAARKAAY